MQSFRQYSIYFIALVLPLFSICGCDKEKAKTIESSWDTVNDRTWVGPQYWANRLQDWQINDGRLECVNDSPANPMRTVHLLTTRIDNTKENFGMSVSCGTIDSEGEISNSAGCGFIFGAGSDLDYRAAALIHHSPGPGAGLLAGVDGDGKLFFADFSKPFVNDETNQIQINVLKLSEEGVANHKNIALELIAQMQPNGKHILKLTAQNPENYDSKSISIEIDSEKITGNVALFSHPGSGENTAKFWFKDWIVGCEELKKINEREFGPIAVVQHTVSDGVLKMTAQMMPVGEDDPDSVSLEIITKEGWTEIATAKIERPSYTATFKINDWNTTKPNPFQVVYKLKQANGSIKDYKWRGTVRSEPLDEDEIVVAAFTGNHNVARPGVDGGYFDWSENAMWFPHSDIVESVNYHDPDVLFFSGDQVYEGASPTKPDKSSEENLMLDYMYKWYLWCWAFGDLCKDTVCVSVPDDHDVFQGNLWGANGIAAKHQGDGGYVHPAEFVNMVQKTQTSHLPDPYDATPVEQGIEVYYTSMDYAGISFAILEDRKFKPSAKTLIPGSITVGETEFNKPGFNPVTDADVEGATLLGQRQLDFLDNWSKDWADGIWNKVVLSQTIFAHVQTFPVGQGSKGTVSLNPDEYPIDEQRTNTDSNGWPQTPRNNALKIMRRGFATHIAGDTHLGCTIQYGIEDWGDAGYALCVPSIANFYPRRWYPPEFGLNHLSNKPKYTGEYFDSFGNKMTVFAVSNPVISGKEPAELHDKAPGYGIARFRKSDRTITLENWPRCVDPSKVSCKPYPGWPVVFNQLENYSREAFGYLPKLIVSGVANPVVQVIDQADNKVVYTIRIKDNNFAPKVFKDGKYTIKVGEPNTEKLKIIRDLEPAVDGEIVNLNIKLEENH